jgi:hypothetical protein
MDLTECGAEDGHIYTRMLLAPCFLEEGDEERWWREQEQWGAATAIFALV